MRLLSKEQTIPNVNLVNSYYEHPALIHVSSPTTRGITITWTTTTTSFFSYHGLPAAATKKSGCQSNCYCYEDGTSSCCHSRLRRVNQFCYSAQCFATTRAIAARARPARKTGTRPPFQSRLGFDDWAKPYTIDVLEEWAKERGAKKLLCFSPAFVSDCLETTIEIGLEYQEEFEEWGGEKIDLVPSLNDDPRWIAAVVEMIRAES